jgi:3-methyladenine DNA glycosylase AlkD
LLGRCLLGLCSPRQAGFLLFYSEMVSAQYSTADEVKAALSVHARPDNIAQLQRFFKTGAGEYGEGDKFIGVRVPDTRRVCKKARSLALSEVQILLDSEIHEHRLAAVIIMVTQYRAGERPLQREIFKLYVKNLKAGRINNWDIIDVSAQHIVGAETDATGSIELLEELSKSDSVWCRRVAIISTFHYIIKGEPDPTIAIAERLLTDEHDLIHKATGWMLREVGKRVDEQMLISFLDEYAHKMPRTMLRYAIERLDEPLRLEYLKTVQNEVHRTNPEQA